MRLEPGDRWATNYEKFMCIIYILTSLPTQLNILDSFILNINK